MIAQAAGLASRLRSLYPVLDALPPALCAGVLSTEALAFTVPRGQLLFEEGAPCQGFPMVLSGEVRVARGEPGGRTMELYRVTPGELCVASTSCLFGQVPLVAHGQAAADTELVVLSPAAFDRWLAVAPFRRFIFGIFADRFADLMALVEAVAFQRLDQRLAGALLGRGNVVHPVPSGPWPTSWGRCARSSLACCGNSSARGGSAPGAKGSRS